MSLNYLFFFKYVSILSISILKSQFFLFLTMFHTHFITFDHAMYNGNFCYIQSTGNYNVSNIHYELFQFYEDLLEISRHFIILVIFSGVMLLNAFKIGCRYSKISRISSQYILSLRNFYKKSCIGFKSADRGSLSLYQFFSNYPLGTYYLKNCYILSIV